MYMMRLVYHCNRGKSTVVTEALKILNQLYTSDGDAECYAGCDPFQFFRCFDNLGQEHEQRQRALCCGLEYGLCDLLGAIDYPPFAWRAWVAEATRLRPDWWLLFRMLADWVLWGEPG